MPSQWYLKDPETVKKWQFGLITVDFWEKRQAERVAESIEMAEWRKESPVVKSCEKAVDLIKALMGFQTAVSNVIIPSLGQMLQMPLGSIEDSN